MKFGRFAKKPVVDVKALLELVDGVSFVCEPYKIPYVSGSKDEVGMLSHMERLKYAPYTYDVDFKSPESLQAFLDRLKSVGARFKSGPLHYWKSSKMSNSFEPDPDYSLASPKFRPYAIALTVEGDDLQRAYPELVAIAHQKMLDAKAEYGIHTTENGKRTR